MTLPMDIAPPQTLLAASKIERRASRTPTR